MAIESSQKLPVEHYQQDIEPKNGSLSDKAYEYILDNIISGKILPGMKISERSIAQKLSFSTLPVREAMDRLSKDNWIIRIPQKGTFVKTYDIEDLNRLYHMREVLEAGNISIVAEKVSGEQLKNLSDMVDRLESAGKRHDTKEYEKIDLEFHKSIISASDNPRLEMFFNSIILQSTYPMITGRIRVSIVWHEGVESLDPSLSHRMIYEALREGDSEKAEDLIRRHIRLARNVLLAICKSSKNL